MNGGSVPEIDPTGKLLGNAWRLYRGHFLVSLEIVVIPLAIAVLSRIYFGPLSSHSFGWWQAAFSSLIEGFGAVALLFLFTEGTGFLESYRRAFNLVVPYLWFDLLITLAIWGGVVMLLIPGIILLIWALVSLPIFVIEKKRGLSVIAQSGEYADGYWWRIFGRLLIVVTPVAVVDVLLIHFFGTQLDTIYAGIVSLFVAPFSLAVFYELYLNLTVVKPTLSASQPTKHFGFLRACIIVGTIVVVLMALLRVLDRPSPNDSYFMSQWPNVSSEFRRTGSDFSDAATAIINNDNTSTISDMQDAQSALQDAQTQLDNATRGPLSPDIAQFKSLASDTIASGLNAASGTILDIKTGNFDTYPESEFMTDITSMHNDEAQAQQLFLKWQLLNWQ